MIDVIIPAHNEAETIASVVGAVAAVAHPIVVADRCTDNTASLASEAGADVISGTWGGKGQVMRAGLMASESERIAFCDADLIGLQPYHVAAFTSGDGQTVGILDNFSVPFGCLSLSGERSLPRSVAGRAVMKGWGAETALNAVSQGAHLKTSYVRLVGVTHRTKIKKHRFLDYIPLWVDVTDTLISSLPQRIF